MFLFCVTVFLYVNQSFLCSSHTINFKIDSLVHSRNGQMNKKKKKTVVKENYLFIQLSLILCFFKLQLNIRFKHQTLLDQFFANPHISTLFFSPNFPGGFTDILGFMGQIPGMHLNMPPGMGQLMFSAGGQPMMPMMHNPRYPR